MRYVTNGNIHAPTMMLAEKAADLILGHEPLPPKMQSSTGTRVLREWLGASGAPVAGGARGAPGSWVLGLSGSRRVRLREDQAFGTWRSVERLQ
jgi:hypothetical protein